MEPMVTEPQVLRAGDPDDGQVRSVSSTAAPVRTVSKSPTRIALARLRRTGSP